MNLLFVGDIVGKSGCDFFAKKLYTIKKDYNIDITVVNGENSAQGNGITRQSAEFLFQAGVDVITTGNHAFKRREAVEMFNENDFLVRPANYPAGCVGKGLCILDLGRCQIAIINLMGVVYLEPLDNPFTVVDKLLEEIETPNIFVDFHAEATAEKKAMGFHLSKRVTAMFGTHTHVQTADECVLDGHTGYITDVGMSGAEESVLGVKKEIALEKMRSHFPVKFEESDKPCFINAVVVSFDEKFGKCDKISRVILRQNDENC
ncbi:MAG: TIGR00282 family metallophosphoesterase [Oscillospiraceae bacterium]